MANIKLILAYDGADFYGWQKNEHPSVEETLEQVLEKILQQNVTLQAASRTDRGVHAREQVVNFFTDKSLDLEKFRVSVNQLLPNSIALLEVSFMPQTFHPTLDAKAKEYHYHLCTGIAQYPHERFTSWHMPCKSLNLSAMEEAAKHLIGEHDFSAFCLERQKGEYDDCVRRVDKIIIEQTYQDHVCIKVMGKSFFYKMVRTLVGTLIEVGRGRKEISGLLRGKERAGAGVCAPAHGLTLFRVFY